MTIVVIGCGWVGLPLAAELARDGHTVHGTTTRAARLDEIARHGVQPHRFAARPSFEGDAPPLAEADRVVIAVPPTGLDDRYADAVAGIAGAATSAQIVQLSSTGVYPDREGHPVTREEDVAVEPGERAARLLAAEVAVREAAPVATVLRLAGLWGYGRHPVRYLAGRRIGRGDAPVNLVHRDDVIAAVRAVSFPEPIGGTYSVVADDHPSRGAFYRSEAERLGLPPPVVEPDGPEPSRGKRVVGDRLAEVTGFRPRWRPGDPDAP